MQKYIVNKVSVKSILSELAKRLKERRLEKNLSQREFAERAGIGYDAYRKFEATGETTVRNLILTASVLDDSDVFSQLFSKRAYQNIDEVIAQKQTNGRRRASSQRKK